jgi:hypothetical protein
MENCEGVVETKPAWCGKMLSAMNNKEVRQRTERKANRTALRMLESVECQLSRHGATD